MGVYITCAVSSISIDIGSQLCTQEFPVIQDTHFKILSRIPVTTDRIDDILLSRDFPDIETGYKIKATIAPKGRVSSR